MTTREETDGDLKIKKPTLPRSISRARFIVTALVIVTLLATMGMLLFGIAFGDAGPASLLALVASPTHTAVETATSTLPPTLTRTPLSTETPLPSATTTDTQIPSATPIPTATLTPLPEPTPDVLDREFYIPILMYHYISTPSPEADPYRLDLSVPPEDFRAQIQWLSDNDYTPLTLYDLLYALQIGKPPLPDKPIILTFDDGYVDNYQHAFPILEEFGFKGTFFILTDVTDREQPGYMTWPMLKEMAAAGHSIEVHGREHLEMIDRSPEWLIYHLRGPSETIEAQLGYQPRFLAYPSGKYDRRVIDIAHQEGYWGAVTTVHGIHQTKTMPFELTRLRVKGAWSLDVFSAVVSSGG